MNALHESIGALRDSLAKYMEDGVEMSPEAVTAIVAMLDSMAEEAAELDEIAHLVARHHGLPPEVLKIAAMLNKNGVTKGMPGRDDAPVTVLQ